MTTTHQTLRRFGILIVVIHLLISLVHGIAHSRLHIDMNQWQSLYILIVITVLPLVSAILLWRSRTRSGFWLLLISMLGSLLFGGYFHFIAAGADNLSSLGSHSWAQPFQLTAVLLAISEAAGVLLGLLGLIKQKDNVG